MIWILLEGGAAAADCPAPVEPLAWGRELDAAEQGYAALDATAFSDHLDAASLDLPCLKLVVGREHAARYHALIGLRLYVGGDREGAGRAFAAARASDLAYELPETLVPAGHEVRALFDAAEPGPLAEVPEPAGVVLFFDGSRGEERPEARPTIFQIWRDAELPTTAYVAPGEPLPAYPTAAAPVVTVVPVPPPDLAVSDPVDGPKRPPKWGFLAGAGVAGGTGAILYALAASGAAKFAAPLDPDAYGREELVALRSRTNGLVIGSGAAGGLAAVSATLFVVTLP